MIYVYAKPIDELLKFKQKYKYMEKKLFYVAYQSLCIFLNPIVV